MLKPVFWSLLLFSAFQNSESWVMPSKNVVPRTSALTRPHNQRLAALLSRESRSFVPQIVGSHRPPARQQSSTRLPRGFNWPPGKNNDNELAGVVKGVLGFALLVGFFISPLGGFVLSIFNSFLILAILLPIGAVTAFQAWQYFNTLSGPCPNCDTPLTVLKNDGEGVPTVSICYSCGATVQANYDNTKIDNVSGRNSVMDDDAVSGFGSLLDLFAGGGGREGTTTTSTTTVVEKKKENKFRREQTIIDVDVEEDKPFQ
jgi:DNA-directed RNA polymerase subunit M/transcription elongation factor TFIIS